MPKYRQFCCEILYCIEPVNIRGKIQFCPVASCSNDRVVFASMLHVFYSKHEQEETALLIDRRFNFVPKQYCIFLTELLHHKEIWNVS